jgi:hypothetical protein
MVLLGDIGRVETCFGPFGDSVGLSARLVHCLRRTYHRLGSTPDGTPGGIDQEEDRFSLFGDSVNVDAR